MQTQQTITLFGTVGNSASSRNIETGRKYTAFGVAIISDRNLPAFSYNVVAWGKEGHFAKSLQKGTRIKLVVQAQSSPTTSPASHSSPQPSCDRFVRSYRGCHLQAWDLWHSRQLPSTTRSPAVVESTDHPGSIWAQQPLPLLCRFEGDLCPYSDAKKKRDLCRGWA
jgi:hypothetical protein